jgi:hypothetical protein
MKTLGYIAYEGPSLIDGAPIVVIVNKLDGSDNAKTGAIVQSFIIRSDVAPVDALKTGADESICGNCPHRPILAKTNGQAPCYVNVGRSVRAVYEAYRRGRYTRAEAGRKATCAKCTLCSGTSIQARDIVIADHAAGHARRVIKIGVAA